MPFIHACRSWKVWLHGSNSPPPWGIKCVRAVKSKMCAQSIEKTHTESGKKDENTARVHKIQRWTTSFDHIFAESLPGTLFCSPLKKQQRPLLFAKRSEKLTAPGIPRRFCQFAFRSACLFYSLLLSLCIFLKHRETEMWSKALP